jgi:hypothetical protein
MTLSIYLSLALFTLIFLIFHLRLEDCVDRKELEDYRANILLGLAGLAWPLVLPILILRVIILITYKISAKVLGKTETRGYYE